MESIESVAREGLACVVHMELEVLFMFNRKIVYRGRLNGTIK
jgi:hypothetical protein